MVDFHSHVLPGIDDGSKSPEESRIMMEECIRQGVSVLCATPHFYAITDTPSLFLERRSIAYSSLKSFIPDKLTLLPGAEVLYFEGISRSDCLNLLTIEHTDFLLLEMPYSIWSGHVIDEVCRLADSRHVRVLLAHIDRYLKWQPKEVWLRLADHGIFMQVNTDAFLNRFLFKKLFWFFKHNLIDVIGSDMHDSSLRKSHMQDAQSMMIKKFGEPFVKQFDDRGISFIKR